MQRLTEDLVGGADSTVKQAVWAGFHPREVISVPPRSHKNGGSHLRLRSQIQKILTNTNQITKNISSQSRPNTKIVHRKLSAL